MLRVGTSGWQYRDWRGRFYPKSVPAARWLEHYAARFATVEINNTFYRLPAPATFAAWNARVPSDFAIAVKASRYLTHYKRLRDPEEPVERLMTHARALSAHLGPVLLQLPPDLPIELARGLLVNACDPVVYLAVQESASREEIAAGYTDMILRALRA